MSNSQASKPNFQLQLLSDRKLVLAESENYESEIFMPRIKLERITLVNVIPGRDVGGKAVNREIIHKGKSGILYSSLHKMPYEPKALTPIKNYVIKLISNKNVVLVECNGYDSEIFLPYIQSRGITMKRVSGKDIVECSRWESNLENKLTVNPTVLLDGLRGALVEVKTIDSPSFSNRKRQKGGKYQKPKPYQYSFEYGIESLKPEEQEKVHSRKCGKHSPKNCKQKKNVSTVLVKRKNLKRLTHRDRGDLICGQLTSRFTNAIGALNGSKNLPKILATCPVPAIIDKK